MINIFENATSVDIADYSDSNGDAALTPISATLEMNINGVWQLQLEHPYDSDGKYKYLKKDNIIRIDADNVPLRGIANTTQYLLYRIYDSQETLTSVVVIAFPVGMEATYDAPIQSLDIGKCKGTEAISAIIDKLDDEGITKYTLTSNVSKKASASYQNTNLIALLCGDDDNAFVSKWGGEVLYENWHIYVLKKLGDQSGNVRVEYGRNLTGINYEVDTSQIVTRIYPISADGIRLNEYNPGENNYVASANEVNYAYAHTTFISTPDLLANYDTESTAENAVESVDLYNDIYGTIHDALVTWWNDLLESNSDSEYFVQNMVKEGLIETIQETLKTNLETEVSTMEGYINDDLYDIINSAVEEGIKWIKDAEIDSWGWIASGNDWKYGNSKKQAKSEYCLISGDWQWFDANNILVPKEVQDNDFRWYTYKNNKRRYGSEERYYLKKTYIYETVSGTLKKYWLDDDGWYDSDKTDDSDWAWQGSGTAADPWWFGDSDATAADTNKFAHDCWLYIDGDYYWFDSEGYYYTGNKIADYDMEWQNDANDNTRWWFGNTDKKTYAVYLKNQWAKIDNEWHKFDNDGYEIATAALENEYFDEVCDAIDISSDLPNMILAHIEHLYEILNDNLTAYCDITFATGVDLPLVNITVNMVDLSKTTEYAGYESLEKICLGDKVKCIDSVHNRNIDERVVGLKYDLLKGYNTEVSIGSPNKTAAEKIGLEGGRQITGRIEVEQETRGLRRAATRDAQIEDIEASKTTKKLKNKDKYIAGKGIKIVNNVISATGSGGSGGSGGGKGLQYWTETQNEIYQKQTNNIDGWTADGHFIINNTETVQWYKQFENGIWYDGIQYWAPTEFKLYKVTNGKAVIGWYKLLTGTSLALDGTKEPVYLACMYLSDDPTDVAFHKYGARYNQQGELVEWVDSGISSSSGHVEYLGITWYYSFFTGAAGVRGSEGTAYQAEEASQITNQCLNVSYQDTYAEQADRENIAIKILQASNVRISSKTKTGVAVNSAYTFYSGEKMGTESEVEEVDYTFKVSKDGDVYGKEFWLNDNETPISKQIANKQDKLTAGSNINISSSNVISATDTTYNPFGGASSTVAGSAGLVPAPTTSDYEKYLCGDGTWKAVSGGGGSLSAVELSTLGYSQLTTEQKHDATKIYFVNDNGESPKLMYKDVNYTGSGGGGGDILEANDGLYTASAGSDIGMEVVIE